MSYAGLTEFLGRPAARSVKDLGPGSRLGDVTIVRLVDEGGMERIPGGEVPYFVMEYLEDALSITAYAEQRDLSTRDRVTLFCEACRAVAHGHQKGVIHRDLKPGNILVDVSGQPKIIDFGVVRSTDRDVALTTMHTDVGQLVATLAYMAPEQFDGQAGDLDVRADVYALGVVLYELLAGALPFDIAKRPVYEAARIVKEVEPQSLSTVKPRLRGDLNTIVGKCLEKDRVRRYSSATELEADLARYLRGEPIVANPPSLIDSLVRLARRHRAAATAAASILTVLVCAVTGISLFAVRAERQRELAVAARQTAILEARAAATERDTADRQKARADSEADLARKQLYVANLRALRSCADAKNLCSGFLCGVPAPMSGSVSSTTRVTKTVSPYGMLPMALSRQPSGDMPRSSRPLPSARTTAGSPAEQPTAISGSGMPRRLRSSEN